MSKKVLGHSDGTVTAIYVKEMRIELEAWARELTKWRVFRPESLDERICGVFAL
jgi:hypothetical protein